MEISSTYKREWSNLDEASPFSQRCNPERGQTRLWRSACSTRGSVKSRRSQIVLAEVQPGKRSDPGKTERRGRLLSMLIGAHVGQEDPLADAKALKIDAIQMFLGDPQRFEKPDPRPDAEALKAAGIPIYVHAPYRLNVCHPSPRIRLPSRITLGHTVEAAAEIGAAGVIVHAGHAEDDPLKGPMRWWKLFSERSFPCKILIENTAGGQNAVARYVDQLAVLWEKLDEFDVGFCFDTCHAHAAGEDLADVVPRVLQVVGKIDVLHCNDSRDPPGTGADRHANIGDGKIGPEILGAMVGASKADVVILETPFPGISGDLEWVRSVV